MNTTADQPAGVASPIRWIDTHCHVHDARIDGDADRHPAVFATVGLHPHDARLGVDSIADLLTTPGIVAVGEAGLDYHYDHSPRAIQREVFAAQITLAHEYRLPLVIHTREAWDDTFDILDAHGAPTSTILHCFTGGLAELERALALDAYVSFSGIASFSSAHDVRAAATRCPLDRLLIETDSPYLAPVPHRGRPNRPAWVAHVGAAIADLRGTSLEDIATATCANAQRAFPGLAPTS